ncbi:cell division protein FtsQ/DivIB [Fructobacillus evanidus]|uniref:Cell division septal protein FtsQ (FtsQ) n=1 Tax=Fructobacillus evanidus TaxID=3064281 RepID=A0ABM9MNG9_9LACO|nr:Cell division septal protein FtsQ (FtsQ) [Fructobacillus sp. LMG 32999]CAK1227407.1 Cell division septal protein FtsQ (FtsQ) [Fructobacillus sp. LMG 32999]CAK1227704.1 Cell division septal protein FtsQ (FtsQ) [Fructobacillus sp. LMG 32999]CAK1227743.1 Cell division septal protein FtsQ (FtsQ) [Fructobacillus sp. LMG 32999]
MQRIKMTMQMHPKWTSAFVTLAFLAVIAVILVIWQPWVKITTVNVDAGNIPTETIEKEVGIKPGDYRYQVFFQETFLEQKLKRSNDKISQVKISLTKSTVSIEAGEKINAGFLKKGDQWYQLDSAGNQSKINQVDGQGPVYTNFSSVTRIKKVAKAVSSLDQPIRQDIGEIKFAPDANNSDKLILSMNDGNTVYASQKTLADKMQYYAGIAAQMSSTGVVDLQYGSYSYPYNGS